MDRIEPVGERRPEVKPVVPVERRVERDEEREQPKREQRKRKQQRPRPAGPGHIDVTV